MTDPFAGVLSVLQRMQARTDKIPSFMLGVVSGVSPLQVQPDFHTVPLTGRASNFAGPLQVGDRVLILRFGRRVAIIGKSGGGDGAGTITMFAGDTPPDGKLICDGSTLLVADYPRLHAVIGYKYGGSGATFMLPDLRERAPVGVSAGSAEFGQLGQKHGTKTHTLTAPEMPSHSHGPAALSYFGVYSANTTRGLANTGSGSRNVLSGAGFNDQDIAGSTGSTGGGEAHNNIQPSFAVHFVIQT